MTRVGKMVFVFVVAFIIIGMAQRWSPVQLPINYVILASLITTLFSALLIRN